MSRGVFQRAGVRQIGCILVFVLLAGCGGENKATVTGKVTYKGKPVRCGSVVFRNAANTKQIRWGVIKTDGVYTAEKVPFGEMKIGVISRDPSKYPSIDGEGKQVPSEKIEGWFELPDEYETPGGSDLHCNVDSSEVRYDIELK
jgi:hypothetical protein